MVQRIADGYSASIHDKSHRSYNTVVRLRIEPNNPKKTYGHSSTWNAMAFLHIFVMKKASPWWMHQNTHSFFFDMTEGMPNVDIKTFPYTPFASRECSFHTSGALHTHFTHNEELGVNVVQPDWQRYWHASVGSDMCWCSFDGHARQEANN